MLAIVILAAGQSTRMKGTDKLLELVDGAPLLRTIVDRALPCGCAIVVCLPPPPSTRADVLLDLPASAISTVTVADAKDGMAHSIRAGLASLSPRITAAMILPADMPEITSADLVTLIAAWTQSKPQTILRGASLTGTPGHPVIFPKYYFDQLQKLSGDRGAHRVIAAHPSMLHLVPLPARHALTDLDTPQEWANWRAAQI